MSYISFHEHVFYRDENKHYKGAQLACGLPANSFFVAEPYENPLFYAEVQLPCGLGVTVGPPKGFADLRGFCRSVFQLEGVT